MNAYQQIKPNLFLQMEREREQIPHMLREDYIPIFIVKLLRENLSGSEEASNDRSNQRFPSSIGRNQGHPLYSSGKGETQCWTGDSCIDKLNDFESSFLLTDNALESVHRVLTFTKEVMDMFRVDYRKLWECFVEEIEFPYLELLWLLDWKFHILSLSTYLMMLKEEKRIQNIQRQFLSFCFSSIHFESTRDRCSSIIDHFLQTFLISAYCNSGKSVGLENLKKLVDNILFQLSNKLISDTEGMSEMNQQFLLAVLQEVIVPSITKAKYFKHQLIQLLTIFGSDSKSTDSNGMTLEEVIQYQEQFSSPNFLNDAKALGDTIIMMISSPMVASDVLEVVSTSITSPTKNWNRILHLITEWMQKAESGAVAPLKEIIKGLMFEGLSSKNKEKVALAFILARHCSLIAPKIFSRYEKWYSYMFEVEKYSPAKDPECFNFFANLLTEWIPFEPSCFLQVQATFWPFIPPGCRGIWSDYVSLAKVRVAEYNEVECAMEFEPNPNNPVQHDVEMVIKAFENGRAIPQSLAHMWMFRKQYYMEQFLPVLLKKPMGTALSDARLRLIEVLNKEGKVPPDMYSTYKISVKGY